MSIYLITEELAESYSEYIPTEFLSELSREYCKCLIHEDDDTHSVRASIVWEFKNLEEESLQSVAEIVWFFCADKESGKEILKEFDQNVKEKEVKKVILEMPKLSDVETAALEEAGYSIKSSESRYVNLTVGQLRSAKALLKKPLNLVKPLADIAPRHFKAGIMNCVYHKRYGLLDDLPFLPASRFDADISSCFVQDGRVSGLFLVHEINPGTFRPELLFCDEPDASIHLLNMLRFSTLAVLEMAEEGSVIQIKRYNKTVQQLTEKLFPGIKGDTVMIGCKTY